MDCLVTFYFKFPKEKPKVVVHDDDYIQESETISQYIFF